MARGVSFLLGFRVYLFLGKLDRVLYGRPPFKDAHINATPRFKDDIFSKSKVPRRYTVIVGR